MVKSLCYYCKPIKLYQVQRWVLRTHFRIHSLQEFWNYKVLSHLEGKINKTKEKRKPLSDSILILRDQRCALLSSTEIKWKKREKEKTKNLSWYHYIDKSHYCTSTFSADAKIIHVAIACITSAAFCPSILYSRSPLPALKVLLVWKLYFFTEVYLCSLSKERIHSNTS